MEADHRGCGGECPARAESGCGGAVEEKVQKRGGGGATAAACVAAAGVEVWVLQAKEASNAEEGSVGDVALHEKPCVGLVAEKGMELVVATVRVLANPVCVESMWWAGVWVESMCAVEVQAEHQVLPGQ